jgi:hypothetical protein
MNWTEASALAWTHRLIALAVILQTIEQLQVRRACADDGVWRWTVLRTEIAQLPWLLRVPFGWVLPYRNYVALLIARLLAAALSIATGQAGWVVLLLFSQVAICVRFRGTFNGGSDYMSVLILSSLCVALHPNLTRAGLAYIAVQLALSYVIAGLVKLRQREWRSGEALGVFLRSTRYGAPAWVARLATPRRCQLLAIAIIGFETTFPIAFIDPRVCLGLIGLGLCFHLANALVFGLNRFLFAWAAAYPALLFCSQLLDASA